jgi:hypothetical protein
MNFLILDPSSGLWTINEEHVQQHVKQLQKQLAGSKSVLEWVNTWNSCVGRFFSYTFGEYVFSNNSVPQTTDIVITDPQIALDAPI